MLKYLILQYIIQVITCQMQWFVQSGYYDTEIKDIDHKDDNIFAANLVNKINNQLQKPRNLSDGYCDKLNPNFPLNSLSMCGSFAYQNICWKFTFNFWESQNNINYKIDFAGDFGRGVAIFVDGNLKAISKMDSYWYGNWNHKSVLHIDTYLDQGNHEILFYGGENCCDGDQDIRIQRNNTGWNKLNIESLLNLLPFSCTFPCQKCNTDQSICYECEQTNRDLNNNCNCIEGYKEQINNDKFCIQCPQQCLSCNIMQQCDTCIGSINLKSSRIPQNQCKCPQKYYSIFPFQNECLQCNKYCLECTDFINCQKCIGSVNQLSSRKIINQCNCPDGYFNQKDNQECQKCSPQCQSCKNDKYNCTICKLQENVQNTPNCFCLNGFSAVIQQNKFSCIKDLNTVSYFCKQYDNDQQKCLECHLHQNRILTNGKCTCDIYYQERESDYQQPVCVRLVQSLVDQVMYSTSLITNYSLGIIPILLLLKPSLLVHFLDTLQMIIYTKYLNIEFPYILYEYWDLFSGFQFGFLPEIIVLKQNYQQPPKGFYKLNETSFFLQNVNEPLIIFLVQAIPFIIIQLLKNIIFKNKTYTRLNNINNHYEGNIIPTSILSAYFLVIIPAFLQLRSLEIQSIQELLASVLSYINLIVLLTVPFIIFYIAKLIKIQQNNNDSKDNDNNKQLNYSEKYEILFELYIDKNVYTLGHLGFVVIRKILFSFSLVFLNHQIYLNQCLFMILNLLMIFIQFNKITCPYNIKRLQYKEIITELLFIILYLLTIRFSLFGNLQANMGTISILIMIVCTLILLIEIINSIYEIFLELKVKIQNFYIKIKQKNTILPETKQQTTLDINTTQNLTKQNSIAKIDTQVLNPLPLNIKKIDSNFFLVKKRKDQSKTSL